MLSFLRSSQSETNQNVNWLSGTFVWPTYIALIISARILMFYFLTPLLSPEAQWTALSVAHGILTFIAFHWNRGSPMWEDQGAHIDWTVWEQIDNGVPWTETRKFLMVVPILL
jgi:ORMDL family